MLYQMDPEAIKNYSAMMRRHCAPEPWFPRAKITTCVGCGNEFAQWKGQYFKTCPDCSGQVFSQSAVDNLNKTGEYYERSVVGGFKHYLSEMRRLGLPLDVDS